MTTLNDLTWRMSPELYKHFQDGGKVLVRATTVNGHTVEFALADWTRNNGGDCMAVAYSADGKHAAIVNPAAIVAAYVVGVVNEPMRLDQLPHEMP